MEKYFDINEQGFSIRCKIYAKDIHRIQRVVVFGHGFGGHRDAHAAARFAEQAISKYKDVGVMTFADDILIFHGTEDEVVPFEEVRDFADNNVIEFVPVPDTDHCFRNPKVMDQTHQDILNFFGL